MHLDRHHFQFTGSRDIHTLYISLGILAFAEGIIGIFVPIFLWSLGYSIVGILGFYLLNSLAFLATSVMLLPLIRKLRDKTMIGASLPFLIAYFLGLHSLPTHPWLFVALPIVLAIHMLLYNMGYHALFTGATDHAHVGREVGMRYVVSSLAQLGAPLLGGMLIAQYGFPFAFATGSVILLASAIPLAFATPHASTPDIRISTVLRSIGDRQIRGFTWSGVGYAVIASIGRIVWPLALFTSIGSLAKLGALVTVGFFGELLTTSAAGFLSDTARRMFVLRAAASASALVWVTRPLLDTSLALGGSHLVGNAVAAITMVAWSSQYYDIARQSREPGAFILGREILYHLARIIGVPLLMLAAWLLPQSTFFTISFIVAGVLTLTFFVSQEPKDASKAADIVPATVT